MIICMCQSVQANVLLSSISKQEIAKNAKFDVNKLIKWLAYQSELHICTELGGD